ncbi:MAG: T9SS type A sorting domain-containing protein [Candidatus Stygibacter australis]|nr:T9SS type A sorting domain-containing protein [Candidatus Stygibacter australis]
MKNSVKGIIIIAILLLWQLLMGQEELEGIVTWAAGDSIDFRCENRNPAGSDLNNDGFDDFLMITTGDWFRCYLGGSPVSPDFCFEEEGPYCSGTASWGGDLNGDGYKDIAWWGNDHWGDNGTIYISMGGEEIDLIPEFIFEEGDYSPTTWYIQALNGGYDFNGDGYDDLLAYGEIDMVFDGLIHIFLGAEEFSMENDYYIMGDIEERFGSLFAVGDFNGDGYDDLAASRNIDTTGIYCQLEIYMGGEELDMVCDYILPDSLYCGYFERLPTGDINDDGRDELILYSQESIFKTYNINSSGELEIEEYNIESNEVRILVADINGDGVSDLVCWNAENEIITIYYGGEEINYNYDAYLPVPFIQYYHDYTNFMSNIGDIDGDGKDELLVNDGDGAGRLGNTATVYSLPSHEVTPDEIQEVSAKLTNYPNPFNPETTIQFELAQPGRADISIYNLKGQLVRKLTDRVFMAGRQKVVWDGKDDQGRELSSGIYFYKLSSEQGNESCRMLMIK